MKIFFKNVIGWSNQNWKKVKTPIEKPVGEKKKVYFNEEVDDQHYGVAKPDVTNLVPNVDNANMENDGCGIRQIIKVDFIAIGHEVNQVDDISIDLIIALWNVTDGKRKQVVYQHNQKTIVSEDLVEQSRLVHESAKLAKDY